MKISNGSTAKKSLIVLAALIIGFLMPYLSRIPLAFVYGMPWIWKYMNSFDDFARWNGLHLASLVPIFFSGLIYLFGEMKWAFYGATLGHFAATSFIYYNFGVKYGIDDFLGCMFFPPMIAVASIMCGLLALVIELFINSRKSKD